jgi:2,3-bisphosphoglycerate-independent phosphoglycerate mutase
LNRSEEYDLGFLHIKAVDDAGHDKNLDLKVQFYKKIDQMVSFLVDQLASDSKSSNRRVHALQLPLTPQYVICFTGDHTTPVSVGDHTCEPVPFAVCEAANAHAVLRLGATLAATQTSSPLPIDEVELFNEVDCARGFLGRFAGSSVLSILKNYKELVQSFSN